MTGTAPNAPADVGPAPARPDARLLAELVDLAHDAARLVPDAVEDLELQHAHHRVGPVLVDHWTPELVRLAGALTPEQLERFGAALDRGTLSPALREAEATIDQAGRLLTSFSFCARRLVAAGADTDGAAAEVLRTLATRAEALTTRITPDRN